MHPTLRSFTPHEGLLCLYWVSPLLPDSFHILRSVIPSTLCLSSLVHSSPRPLTPLLPRCRFSLDALQATQIAERLGLAGTGLAEVEANMRLGGDLQGPGGPLDRPQALPLGRNTRTTPPLSTPVSSSK